MNSIEKEFGEKIRKDLHKYLLAEDRVDEKLPECPDVEELWPSVEEAYLSDGVREFAGYPVVSLGWIMFVGMALAYYWDENWTKYSGKSGKELYEALRDAKGYDNLDDYVLKEVLHLDDAEAEKVSAVVGECAARTLHSLRTSGIESGTREAALSYVAALKQLYLMGMAMELNAMGYHMTALG